MTNRQRKVGAVVAAFAAAVAAWLPATSAQAADGPVVHIFVVNDSIGVPVPTQDPPQISWGLDNDGPGAAKDVTVKLDFSQVKDWVTVNGKTVDTYTAPALGDLHEGNNGGGFVDLRAKEGTPLGTKGTVTLSGTSSNGTVISKDVEVTAGDVELKVNKLADRKGDKPGSTIESPLTISNTGSLPANGVQLQVLTTPGLSYADRFSNCSYSTVSGDPYGSTQQALCTFDTTVEPGKSYRLDQPLKLDVSKQALYEYIRREALPVRDAKAPSGSGPKLSLVAAGAADTGAMEVGRQYVMVDNTADMAAGGDTVAGAPGDLVHVDLTLSDEGPARMANNVGDDQPALLFTVPTGTKAVEIADRCRVWNPEAQSSTGERTPGAAQYVCFPEPNQFEVGDTRTFGFGLKIREGAKTTTGEVRATTSYDTALEFDHNPDNNTAPVTVQVEGDDSGATPSPSASATTPGTDGKAGGNDVTPQTVADTAGAGSLASTGSSSVLPVAAAVGAGVLLLGGGLVFVVRRRKA
ncbi:LPXTG cell wall anchor domain-containing protein [Streptomyces sasae]|uniref:LPXTG cell wall anchor domain-containing protein n=1 Tax=Streptomyces sasae TaxID=1266772 RepID=UPI00293019FF|nr:LPXTG cell wall anchor domain-containing protein [Streptomyces sasae]